MRRFLLYFVVLSTFALAQHAPTSGDGPRATERQVEGHDAAAEHDLTGWKWANFAILAGLLGWLIKKNAGPFFESRSKEIQKGISEAAKLRYEAEVRAKAMEERLDGLKAEVESMRTEARQELHAEAERIRAETIQQMAKIHSQAEHDIVAAGKAARQELKAQAAALAVQLAEAKLRGRIDGRAQDRLVDGFVNDLQATRPEVN